MPEKPSIFRENKWLSQHIWRAGHMWKEGGGQVTLSGGIPFQLVKLDF